MVTVGAADGRHPGEYGADPVTEPGEERDVDEPPPQPAGEPGDTQRADLQQRVAAADVGRGTHIPVAVAPARAAGEVAAHTGGHVQTALHGVLGDTREVIAAHQPFSRAAENLRVVRSQLMLRWLHADHDCKSLAVLSPGAKEGRSFVAANLAVVFAQHEERTLLIDGNLRGGRIHEIFKLPKGPGLSNVLADRTTLQSAAMSVPNIPGLAVLTTGALPPNPQELLGRRTFETLLREAAANFKVIIIDTPAADLCADSEIIAARCNASLLVVQRDTSLLSKTAELATRLQQGGINLLGSVLNQA